MAPSKILIVGATGWLGRHITNASIRLGHPTYALVRTTTPSDPVKAQLLETWENAGVTLLVGDIADHASLVTAAKQVDVIISVVSDIPTQVTLIKAAKEAGTIKRFVPSEFGNDVDKIGTDIPFIGGAFEAKKAIRRATEQSGLAYTYVCSFSFASMYLANIAQDDLTVPPKEGKVTIFGDGNKKVVFAKEDDVGTFTVLAVDDPRAVNKTLNIVPTENVATQNELTALWEKKIGHTFEKEYLSSDEVWKSIGELPFPANFYRSVKYSIFVRGDQYGVEFDKEKDVQATTLYPDVKYTTLSEYLDQFV